MAVKNRNAEVVTIKVARNEARLLVPLLMEQLVKLSADCAEGRISDADLSDRWAAVDGLLSKIRVAIA